MRISERKLERMEQALDVLRGKLVEARAANEAAHKAWCAEYAARRARLVESGWDRWDDYRDDDYFVDSDDLHNLERDVDALERSCRRARELLDESEELNQRHHRMGRTYMTEANRSGWHDWKREYQQRTNRKERVEGRNECRLNRWVE